MDPGKQLCTIKIKGFERAIILTNITTSFESDIYLKYRSYIIDATSILGSTLLCHNEPIDVYIIEKHEKDAERLLQRLKENNFVLNKEN